MFENRLLRKIRRAKEFAVTGGSGKKCIVGSCMTCACHQYYSGDNVKGNEVGRICGMWV